MDNSAVGWTGRTITMLVENGRKVFRSRRLRLNIDRNDEIFLLVSNGSAVRQVTDPTCQRNDG